MSAVEGILDQSRSQSASETPNTAATAAAEIDSAVVVQILERYLAALEVGQPLDRQELLAHYPELAEPLAARLDVLDFISCVAPQLADQQEGSTATTGADPRLKCLGDFRLLREMGRGGMGVVYEAEQISLGRRVALKVLPFAAMLGENRLRRFQNEARVAASLDHPNIVAVHAVGVERGVYYYAMQLIQGQSMDRLIGQLRNLDRGSKDQRDAREKGVATTSRSGEQPPRAMNATTVADQLGISTEKDFHSAAFYQLVARLGIQAAQALHYAHENGILHRDIKPANLLLDVEGHLWITDFGLARLQADTGLTLSGDVVGTLRYMSPEQARGEGQYIDPRSDVYSLGATLYELVTLQPAFTSQDNAQLLQQIVAQEPRSPRSIDSHVPDDLETILLKALQKPPEDRYSSAKALAEDLRNYLEHKPIVAKPPSRFTRALRWSRRNHSLVIAVSVFLMFAVLLLSLSSGLSYRSYRQQLKLRTAAEIAVTQRDEAIKQSEQALQAAAQAIDEIFLEVADRLLVELPAPAPLRREFLEKALEGYHNVLQQRPLDAPLRFSAAKVTYALACLDQEGLPAAQRDEWFDDCIEQLSDLVKRYPDVEDYGSVLSDAYRWKGYFCSRRNGDEYEALLLKALNVSEANLRRHPESSRAQSQLAQAKWVLADHCYFENGRYADAMQLATEIDNFVHDALHRASDETFQKCDLWTQVTIAELNYALDRGAAAQYLSAMATEFDCEEKELHTPTLRSTKRGMAYILARTSPFELLCCIAATELANGSTEAALATANRASTLIETIVQEHPDEPRYVLCYGRVLWIRGLTFWRMGHHEEAKRDMVEAIQRAHVGKDHLSRYLTTMLIACPYEELQDAHQAAGRVAEELIAWPRPDRCIAAVLLEYRLGNYEYALQQIGRFESTKFEVEDPAMEFLRAACLLRLDRFDEAQEAYQKACQTYAMRPTFRDVFDVTCHEVMQLFSSDSGSVDPLTD